MRHWMRKWREVIGLVAQGVVNIDHGNEKIEQGSPIHQAMGQLLKMVSEGEVVHGASPLNERTAVALEIGFAVLDDVGMELEHDRDVSGSDLVDTVSQAYHVGVREFRDQVKVVSDQVWGDDLEED